MRREYTVRIPCTTEGCKEVRYLRYSSRKEMAESYDLKHRHSYRCVECKKRETGGVLSLQNLRSEWISKPSNETHTGRYWSGQGLLIGDNHYAEADKFPVGTRIKVTVEVLLPE